jgi:hypothetical protein
VVSQYGRWTKPLRGIQLLVRLLPSLRLTAFLTV